MSIRTLFSRKRRDDELDEEIRAHLAMARGIESNAGRNREPPNWPPAASLAIGLSSRR